MVNFIDGGMPNRTSTLNGSEPLKLTCWFILLLNHIHLGGIGQYIDLKGVSILFLYSHIVMINSLKGITKLD